MNLAASHIAGELGRLRVRVTGAMRIGKESHELEDVQAGLVLPKHHLCAVCQPASRKGTRQANPHDVAAEVTREATSESFTRLLKALAKLADSASERANPGVVCVSPPFECSTKGKIAAMLRWLHEPAATGFPGHVGC